VRASNATGEDRPKKKENEKEIIGAYTFHFLPSLANAFEKDEKMAKMV
jgi:hypothetical protein